MKVSRTLILGGFLAGMLTVPVIPGLAGAHGIGNAPGKAKHHFCYDKHGRWRSHPHCPAPQPYYARRHYGHRDHYHHHPHYDRYDTGHRYQHRPRVIYVRKDAPYDYRNRYSRAPLGTSRDSVEEARREVRQGREQLREQRAELKKDRAELRRDIRNGASKEEIRNERQEIRADLQRIKETRRDIRDDRRELAKR